MVLVVTGLFPRPMMGFGIQIYEVNGLVFNGMFNGIIAVVDESRCISTDRDPVSEFHRSRANLRILDMEEITTVPQGLTSHSFVERLIGNIRQDLRNHLLPWKKCIVKRKLAEVILNFRRFHVGLDGKTSAVVAGDELVRRGALDLVRCVHHCVVLSSCK
jgi:hypothetical protein